MHDGKAYHVLDAVSTLHLGKWELPGRTGRRPTTNVVSAYRDIVYVDDGADGVPFGSRESSWRDTQEDGRRNTLISVSTDSKVVRLPYIATPGHNMFPVCSLSHIKRPPWMLIKLLSTRYVTIFRLTIWIGSNLRTSVDRQYNSETGN